MGKDWRVGFNARDSKARMRVEARIRAQFERGMVKGATKYGADFQGDPLQHAFEEACDLAIYLACELERRDTR